MGPFRVFSDELGFELPKRSQALSDVLEAPVGHSAANQPTNPSINVCDRLVCLRLGLNTF